MHAVRGAKLLADAHFSSNLISSMQREVVP